MYEHEKVIIYINAEWKNWCNNGIQKNNYQRILVLFKLYSECIYATSLILSILVLGGHVTGEHYTKSILQPKEIQP